MSGPPLFKPAYGPGSFLYLPIALLHPMFNTLVRLPVLPGQQALSIWLLLL